MRVENNIIYAEEGKKIARVAESTFAEDFGSAFPLGTLTEADFIEVAIADLPPKKPEEGESFDERVERRVRAEYSISQEFAILRQRDSKPEEFKAYNDRVEQIKKEERL